MRVLTSLFRPILFNYNELDGRDDLKAKEFRLTIKNFIKWYSHITQIARIFDEELEREYVFLAYLIKFLPAKPNEKINLDDKIQLEFYKLKESYSGNITLEKTDDGETVNNSNGVAGQSKKDEEWCLLDEVIKKINEQYKGNFTEDDKVIIDMVINKMTQNVDLAEKAKSNDT